MNRKRKNSTSFINPQKTQKKRKLGNTKGFRNWFLTLNNYTDNDILTLKSFSNCNYLFQEEMGDLGTPHLQGVFMFKNQKSFESLCNRIPKAHWEVLRSKKFGIEYCKKLKTRCGNVYTNIPNLKIKKRLITEYRPWQVKLIQLMKKYEEDDRKIIWVVGRQGSEGKTVFAKDWYNLNPDETAYVCGKAGDMKYFLAERFFNDNEEIKYIFIDCVRSEESTISYKGIEEIKNGFFFSTKYKSKMVSYNIVPTLVIFSNEEPNYSKLSKDRWIILDIDQDKLIEQSINGEK